MGRKLMNVSTQVNEELPINRTGRHSVVSTEPSVLTDIYREDTNIIIWQREFSKELQSAVNFFIANNAVKSTMLTVTPQTTIEELNNTFGSDNTVVSLYEDITLLVDMFCCLFDLKGAGLRLTVLERPMCPRFHVDRIPCRLVTTYKGTATEWLDHHVIDRTKLGAGNKGKSDENSGLIQNIHDINQLNIGDVALLKGENWSEEEGVGLVHRSPNVVQGECRLLITLDFISE
jgi:hypothetical protein